MDFLNGNRERQSSRVSRASHLGRVIVVMGRECRVRFRRMREGVLHIKREKMQFTIANSIKTLMKIFIINIRTGPMNSIVLT